MSTDLDAKFNEQFMSINMKLKKRFMRKPNMDECAKEFIMLAVRCQYSEQPTFAGHAYVGAAKCRASAGKTLEEADNYVMAAKQFMKAEKKLRSMKFYSPDRENLEAAIGCYIAAYNKYPETSLKKVSILMGLASELSSLGHKEEALAYYSLAADHDMEHTMRANCLKYKIDLEIDCEKYELALETANAMVDHELSPETQQNDNADFYLSEIQVTRILLTLLVKPLNNNEPASLKQLFTDLMNDNDSDSIPFHPDLKLKMQSIISTTMSGDVESLVTVACEAVYYLTTKQEDLLQALITQERAEHLALT